MKLPTVLTAIISIIAGSLAAPYWLIFRPYMGWRATLFMVVMWAISPAAFSIVQEINQQFHELPGFSLAYFDMWWRAAIPFIAYQVGTSVVAYLGGKPAGHAGRWILYAPNEADFVLVIAISAYCFLTHAELLQFVLSLWTDHQVIEEPQAFFVTSMLMLVAYWALDMIAREGDNQFRWLGTTTREITIKTQSATGVKSRGKGDGLPAIFSRRSPEMKRLTQQR